MASTKTTPKKAFVWPYRLYLNPLLHKQFTKAVVSALAVCYLEAILMGNFWKLWTFISASTVFRALILSLSCLCIYILRLSQIHFGLRTTMSPIQTFMSFSLGNINGLAQTLRTCILYILSSILIVEGYLATVSEDRDLGWVHHGRPYERAKLNERPLFLRAICHTAAIAQALRHISKDLDRVTFPMRKDQAKPSPTRIFHRFTPVMAIRTLSRSFIITVLGTFTYFILLRSFYWSFFSSIAKGLFLDIPRASEPGLLPYRFPTVFLSTLSVVALQNLLWDICNTYFDVYLSRPPLKKGHPLSDESKDPNGTLLIGLRAKREVQKHFALWELVLITASYEQRRKSLFEDIDRPKGSSWKQIAEICLAEVANIDKRIEQFLNPILPLANSSNSEPLQTLPRMTGPIKDENVIIPAKTRSLNADGITKTGVDALQRFAKSHGSHPDPASPRKLIEYGSQKLLAAETRAHASSSGFFSQVFETILRNPYIGWTVQQTFRRRAIAVVLGSPYAQINTSIDAAFALSNLAVHSINEDKFGEVQKDIPTIIRTLTTTIQTSEAFLQQLGPHWTDVKFDSSKDRKVPEVEEALKLLRDALREIVVCFGEYLDGMGMRRAEIAEVKKLLDGESEMQMIQRGSRLTSS